MTAKEAKALTTRSIEEGKSGRSYHKLYDNCMKLIEERAKEGYDYCHFSPWFHDSHKNMVNLTKVLESLKFGVAPSQSRVGGLYIDWRSAK